jgi:hypothetical protein
MPFTKSMKARREALREQRLTVMKQAEQTEPVEQEVVPTDPILTDAIPEPQSPPEVPQVHDPLDANPDE